jgi:hypothetical protein
MYQKLYQYLISHKELALPGIGTFFLERKPAENDFFNKRITPPAYTVNLHTVEAVPSANFFYWLADSMGISEGDAVVSFNNFSSGVKHQIINGSSIEWEGVGILSKGLGGEIKFKPLATELVFEKSVTAEKVIRQNEEHMVRVGEDQKTSGEMIEMLHHAEEKKRYWWAYAAVVALLGFIFLGWYFSKHGVEVAATANGKLIVPQEAGATYKTLP